MARVDLDAVSTLLADCGLSGATRPRLARSHTNDVFLTRHQGRRYVVKVYGAGWRNETEVGWEAALLAHLADRGAAVSRPVPRLDGAPCGVLDTQGGRRCVLVTEYVPGEVPQRPFTSTMYRDFGRAIAWLHEATTGFDRVDGARPYDLRRTLEEPVALIRSHRPQVSDKRLLTQVTAACRARLTELAGQGLDFGICHGDVNLDNVVVDGDGRFAFYDFDLAGPGWRAWDHVRLHRFDRSSRSDLWDYFHAGYDEVRVLGPADLAALPYLDLVEQLWSTAMELTLRVLRTGPRGTTAFLDERLTQLRRSWDTLR
ncbi:Ser/Thr protein kinase RdoA (MazF antagonist) [Crossiella equi]|uniref:Ser/Thr protein kinase RdoA (MazF antagonist) n=1 Tax=Crossiella equi TaxID=130796 RepID=A0ABS5A921_9PSEU|nr:phosphotransferase [Crossiella equi]MBP2472719.1 Ser/Thr protein kinase RdoA (MazF antagonist) [Crossiella equi]